VDGEYRWLEIKGFTDGEERHSWLGLFHELFFDERGRVITFINDYGYAGIVRYEHLVLTDDYAELHLLVEIDWGEFDVWQKHHWNEWGQGPDEWGLLDSWVLHNPTIFGTDIPIVPIQSLTALEIELFAEISKKLLSD